MAGSHLSNEVFFAQLAEHFDYRKTRDHGAVYLTQKRLTYNQNVPPATSSDPTPDLPQPLPLLIRATDGKGKKDREEKEKLKLSTVVQPADVEAFFVRYQDVCKAGMGRLKPRDRSKKKGKAKKKKAGGGAVAAGTGAG